jgi:oligopeptide/dipeptide ABC transporter ATP-binding protein
MAVKEGETYGLVGESGCGKSTFGKTVLQLERPTEGEVVYYGKQSPVDLTKCKGKELRALRKELQIIFQDPYSSLNPRMTVGQIIEEGVATHGFFKKGSEEMRAYVLEMMKKCGLQGYMAGRYPHQFSGGQRQRICIARALAVKPKFVVCDECVSALDVSIQSQILNLLTELKKNEGLTYLFISHDLSVVRYISDRIGVMYLGKIVEEGGAGEVFENPLHPYTLALISAIPTIEEKKKERILLSGSMPSAVSPPSGCPFHTRCFMAKEVCKRVPAPLEEVKKGHFCACHFARKSAEEKRRLIKPTQEHKELPLKR